MTYGISVKNSKGWNVFDDFGTYYVKTSGNSLPISGTGENNHLNVEYCLPSQYYGFLTTDGIGGGTITGQQFATDGVFYLADNVNFIPNSVMSVGDTIFYDISSNGLACALSYFWDDSTFGTGGSAYLITENNTPIKYYVASTTIPTVSLDTDYGLQLFNESSEKIYDSRYPQLAIFDHLIISQADIADVLDNNAVKTYTLSKSVSNAIFSVANHSSARELYNSSSRSNSWNLAMLKQISANTLQLSRVHRKTSTFSAYATDPVRRAYDQDVVVLCGRVTS